MARRRRLGGDRARQPSYGVSLEHAARRVGRRHRCRRACRVDGLLGAAVRDGGMGRGAVAGGRRGRRPPPPTPLHRRPGMPASSDVPRPLPPTRIGRPSWRPTPGYDPCEPGYATFIEALGQVYCGHLDRYVELTGAVAALPKLATRGYGHRCVRRRSAVGRSSRRGARIDRLGGRCGPRARQPLLDLLHAVDRRVGALQGRLEAGTAGLGRRRRVRARAPRQVLRGLHRTRRGASAHLRRRARGGAGAVRPGDRVVPSGGQRGAAHHHAGQRAGALRARRSSRCRGDAARGPLPRAGELPPRPRARRPRRPSDRAAGRGAIEGAHVGRSDARSQRCRGLRAGSRSSSLGGRSSARHATRSLPA